MDGRKMQKVNRILNIEYRMTNFKVLYSTFIILYMSYALMLAGCAGPVPKAIEQTDRFRAVSEICVENSDKAEAMQTAEDVLGKMHFTIEKADTEQGYIKTGPLAGAQFFEFWRSDNVGAFNFAEANLHSIRRIVELDITQREGKLCIGCDVRVQRLNLPGHQFGGSSQAYQMFSKSKPSMQRLKLHPEQKRGMLWVDLGQDEKLATEILKRISSMLDARRSSLDIEYRKSSIE